MGTNPPLLFSSRGPLYKPAAIVPAELAATHNPYPDGVWPMPARTADDQNVQSSAARSSGLAGLLGAPRAALTWLRSNRLAALLLAVASVASVAALLTVTLRIATNKQATPPITLEQCLEALDQGQYEEAISLAEELREQLSQTDQPSGGALYVLGAAMAKQAAQALLKEREKKYLLAANHLEQARQQGFPPDRQAEGLYLLGKSLYYGGQPTASRPILAEALEFESPWKTELHGLLAAAYAQGPDADARLALEHNARYLADERLSAEARHRGLLQRAHIMLRLGRLSDCRSTIERIPDTSTSYADALVVRGQLLLEEARRLKKKKDPSPQDQQEAQAKLNEALQTLREAEAHDTLSAQATRKAMYVTGLCLLEMGDAAAASRQFVRTHALYSGTPEGLAADLEQADLLRAAGEHATAVAAYRRVLSAISDPENFFNPWLTLEQLRLRIAAAYQAYLENQSFELALQLAESAFNAFPRARALEMTAEAYSAWGQALLAQAEGQTGQKAEGLRAEARKRYRLAGRNYWRLAEAQLASRQYPDLLWQSAVAYFDGQDYPRAIAALRKYLDNELRKRQPQALVRLGEALLAVGQLDKGLDVLRQCAEDYPRDAAAYRARLLAARAFIEQAKFEQAEKLLQENLVGDHLTPASKEWRDSLIALGEVLHAAKRYEEAVARLSEAIQRYPDSPQAPVASYLLADCYRRIAQGHRERLLQHSTGQQRPVQPGEIHAMFSKALEIYQQTQQRLMTREASGELTPLENLVLRNTWFALAGTLYYIGRYEEAAAAYQSIVVKYQNRPEVLQAYLQLSDCYRQVNRPDEARNVLEQAKILLKRMKSDLPFVQTTGYTAQQWSDLLEKASSM